MAAITLIAWTLAGLGSLAARPGSPGSTLPSFRLYDVPLAGPTLDLLVQPLDAGPTPDAAVVVELDDDRFGFLTLRGNGAGRLTPYDLQVVDPLGYSSPPSLAADDLNGDGLVDIGITSILLPQVYFGDGDLSFVGSDHLPTGGGDHHGLDFTDYDGDGDLDSALLVQDLGGWFVDLGTNDGSGALRSLTFLFVSVPVTGQADLLCADVDGDGFDSFFVSSSSGLTELGQLGGGGRIVQWIDQPGSGLRQVVAGDLDGDGTLDLAVASSTDGGVWVLLNDGFGGFPTPTWFATGRRPESLAIGDVDGDGFADLIVPNRADDDVAVLLGDGAGGFALGGRLPMPDEPVRIGLADLDADGDVDFVVGTSAGAALRVGLNRSIP